MDEKRDVIFTKSFDCIIDMDVKHGINSNTTLWRQTRDFTIVYE